MYQVLEHVVLNVIKNNTVGSVERKKKMLEILLASVFSVVYDV